MTLAYTTNGHLKINASEIDEISRRSNVLVEAINRGVDLTDRISKQYKMQDPIAPEILDYIKDYEDICSLFSEDVIDISAAEEGAWEVVKRIVGELWKMLLKLWDGVKHCFRWMFNSQYRASTTAVKYRQMIMLADGTSGVSEKVNNLEVVETVDPDELSEFIAHTGGIVQMLLKSIEIKGVEAVDDFIKRETEKVGIKYEPPKFLDGDSYNIELISGTYSTCGWSLKRASEVCAEYVSMCGASVKLKGVERDIESDISNLRRTLNSKIAAGSDDATLSDTQKELVYKTKILNLIQNGLVILSRRVATIDTVLGRIANDAATLQKGEIPNEDD